MLIDKEELLATVQADIDLQITGIENVEPVMRCLQTILDDVKESPTVDAVPVIRCKDCRYHDITTFRELVLHRCYVNSDDVETIPDGYCYLAERKEE